ncbi:MAG: tetratricopeptide repeat protein, partial [Candidatus Sulfotelmatobacter sp.]
MGTSRVLAVALLLAAGLAATAQEPSQATNQPAAQAASAPSPTGDQSQNPQEGSPSNKPSSDKPIHEKTGPNSSQTIRHYKIPVEDSQPVELTQAENAIQRRNYAAAEPLLHQAIDRDPKNYVAWFDLGYVENALGKIDESIAAYRKSVAAKPDVFESNLNLGLQLAKTGQPDAEQFLRAAIQLKPTSHAAEG